MYFEATALWRWSNYLQQFDWGQKIRVLINVDETSVRLVPEEGKGHVSNSVQPVVLRHASWSERFPGCAEISHYTCHGNMRPRGDPETAATGCARE